MKKWVRVGILLLLVSLTSLVVVHHLYSRIDKLTESSALHPPRAHHGHALHPPRAHHGHEDDLLEGLQKIQRYKSNLYKRNEARSKMSKGITLAVVEEHQEGKHNRR